jgi:hypothetical protein
VRRHTPVRRKRAAWTPPVDYAAAARQRKLIETRFGPIVVQAVVFSRENNHVDRPGDFRGIRDTVEAVGILCFT